MANFSCGACAAAPRPSRPRRILGTRAQSPGMEARRARKGKGFEMNSGASPAGASGRQLPRGQRGARRAENPVNRGSFALGVSIARARLRSSDGVQVVIVVIAEVWAVARQKEHRIPGAPHTHTPHGRHSSSPYDPSASADVEFHETR